MKKNYIKLAILIVALIGLGAFLYSTDWSAVLAAIQKVGFKFLLPLSITFFSNWLGVWAWRCCMPKESYIVSGWQLFWIRLFGETAAILNPASVVGGEALKVFLLREKGVEDKWALHSILLSRVLMILSQLLLILLMGIWLLTIYKEDLYWLWDYWAWSLLIPVIIGLIIYLWRQRHILQSLSRRLPFLDKRKEIYIYITDLWQQLAAFYRLNKWSMFLAFVFSLLHWIVGSLEFYIILSLLGIDTTVLNTLLVDMGVVIIKSIGAFVPGQIGIEEYGNKIMLAMIGITGGTIWVTASILRRSRQLFWMLVAAVMYFVIFKKKQPVEV